MFRSFLKAMGYLFLGIGVLVITTIAGMTVIALPALITILTIGIMAAVTIMYEGMIKASTEMVPNPEQLSNIPPSASYTTLNNQLSNTNTSQLNNQPIAELNPSLPESTPYYSYPITQPQRTERTRWTAFKEAIFGINDSLNTYQPMQPK